jgi:hypothetical protein
MHQLRQVVIAALTVSCLSASLGAQNVETPVPFDSAGKVRMLTPVLVERFGLVPPAWPVEGDFAEARLFATGSGERVLVVTRRTGTVERYPLSGDALLGLTAALEAGISASGAATMEASPETVSEPARGAFVRNQMGLSFLLYGPLLASLADDGQTATALYLLGAGGSYFVTTGISRGASVTRAQNHLATDGAFRGWGASAGLMYALGGGGVGQKAYSTIGLAGALTGAITGYQFGKRLSDSEARSATTISTLAAGTVLGLTGALGLADDNDDRSRLAIGSTVAAGVAGYFAGPGYPRSTPYVVTSGDVQMLMLGAVLGAAVGMTPVLESDIRAEPFFAMTTAGWVAGALIADRVLVRPFDHSTADATQIQLGMTAGALVGAALAVLVEPPAKGVMALVTGGAIGGTMAGHALAAPPRAGRGMGQLPGRGSADLSSRIQINPAALLLSAKRVRGAHPVVSLTF